MVFSIGFFCSHSVHNVTLRRIQNLNGFLYRIFLFTLRAQRDAPTHKKLEWLFISDFLFTLRAQRDAPTYTKLKWLFYWIFLFTLRAQHDAPTYTKTTDQCGARSGSPQLSPLGSSQILRRNMISPLLKSGDFQNSFNTAAMKRCTCLAFTAQVRSHSLREG